MLANFYSYNFMDSEVPDTFHGGPAPQAINFSRGTHRPYTHIYGQQIIGTKRILLDIDFKGPREIFSLKLEQSRV